MDHNLIITRQQDGRIIVASGGLEMGSVAGLQAALGLARTAADFLAEQVIEARVREGKAKDGAAVDDEPAA